MRDDGVTRKGSLRSVDGAKKKRWQRGLPSLGFSRCLSDYRAATTFTSFHGSGCALL
jgi:hypothetical protein